MPTTKRPLSLKLEQQPQTNGVEVKQTVEEITSEVATNTEVNVVKKSVRYKSPFIDIALCDLVAEDTAEIKSHLVKQGKAEFKTGELLNKLKLCFHDVAANLGTLEDLEWERAFNEYVQIHFGIKASRASEYIRTSLLLAEYKSIQNLEVSKLVEISRLEQESIDRLLKAYPVEKLNEFTYREVKNAVRKFNPKKRDTTPVDKNKTAKTQNTESTDSSVKQPASNLTNLEDYIEKTKSTPTIAFASAAAVMKKEAEASEITEELCRIIDELYQWKMEKLKMKASGQ
jgi:hypothetical protein